MFVKGDKVIIKNWLENRFDWEGIVLGPAKEWHDKGKWRVSVDGMVVAFEESQLEKIEKEER